MVRATRFPTYRRAHPGKGAKQTPDGVFAPGQPDPRDDHKYDRANLTMTITDEEETTMPAQMPERAGGYPPAPNPTATVQLRNRETDEVQAFYTVDAREILTSPNTIYELVEGERLAGYRKPGGTEDAAA